MDKIDLQQWVIRKIRETQQKKECCSDAMKLVLGGKLETYSEFGKKLLELE